MSGVVGLYIPCEVSRAFKKRQNNNNSPIDCFLLSVGFFGSAIFVYTWLTTIHLNIYVSMFLYMCSVASFNVGWVVQAQCLLDITKPSVRSTANALIICILHLIGDSVSPYWMGVIADKCIERINSVKTISNVLECTRLSYYPLVYVSFISAALALFMTFTFQRDKQNASQEDVGSIQQ